MKHDHSLHNVRQSGYKCAVARLIGQVDTSSSLVHSGMVRFNFFLRSLVIDKKRGNFEERHSSASVSYRILDKSDEGPGTGD